MGNTKSAFLAMLMLVLSTAATRIHAADDWETVLPGGDSSCANGEKYRFHVRKADPEKLMIFFNGGGACWNAHTCDPANNTNDPNKGMFYRMQPTDEYGNDPRSMPGAFDLDNPENPFGKWSQLFVVYCTGDIHLGGKEQTYTRDDGSRFEIRHRGKANAYAALDYAATHFPGATSVFVSGSSAGAIASHLYAADAAERFPNARIVQFSGGSGGYRMPVAQSAQWETWGTFESMPDWWDTRRFNAHNTRLLDLIYPAFEAHPEIRFHHYDTAYDKVQEYFLGLLNFPALLYDNLARNNEELSRDITHYRYYVGKGEFHTILRFDDLYQRQVNGHRAVDWIRDIANGKDVPNHSCGSSAQCR